MASTNPGRIHSCENSKAHFKTKAGSVAITNITSPAVEEAAELFSDIPMLWNEATPDERRRLLGTLIEMVYIDLKTKHVAAIRPTSAFRALFGIGIDTAPDGPIQLLPSGEDNKEMFGVGGGGGGLNSPSRRRLPEPATSLASSFISPD